MSVKQVGSSTSHPEDTLRGAMIREAWDARPFITYADAVAVVDAILASPRVRHLLAQDRESG